VLREHLFHCICSVTSESISIDLTPSAARFIHFLVLITTN
jgi:hypothetical protein